MGGLHASEGEGLSLTEQVCERLRRAIVEDELSFGENISEDRVASWLGVSRTPVREAISRLEQEGLVHTIPRRGAFVTRKTRAQLHEMIFVWAALESMAARIATEQASDEQIGRLREMFTTFDEEHTPSARIDEYSDTNIRFHQEIVRLGGNALLQEMAEGLFIHMRAIRNAIADGDVSATQAAVGAHLADAASVAKRLLEQDQE